jgi:PAS domain S-box-containing protein
LEAEVANIRNTQAFTEARPDPPPSSVLESITDAFLAIDGNFNYVWVNTEAERLLATPRNKMVGHCMWHVFPDLVSSNVYEKLHKALAQQVAQEFETRFAPWDRWFFLKVYPTKDGGLSLYVREITDQKRTQQALRDSEERFRLAFQAAEAMVYDWSPRTGTVQRSGNLESILGFMWDEAEPTDEWWQRRIHPEDRHASTLNIISKLPEDQNSFETEFRIRHADGHWVHVCDRGFVIRDEYNTPVRVVGSSQDISHRKRLEGELKASNERLKFQADILATTDDAVIALDPDDLIRYCNQGAERMYGIRCADVMGKPLAAIHHLLRLCTHLDGTDGMLAENSWKGESKHFRSDGSELIVSCTVNKLSPESGGGMVAIVRDISEQKRAELETQNRIREHALQLTRANEDLLHFAYAVSHDLQTPLRTVKSFAQLLALKYKAKLDAQAAEFIRWIVDGSSRMDTMLHDLLQFAKVAGGEAEFRENVALEDALEIALDGLRSLIEETQAAITHDPLPTLPGDLGQFAQLFQNLIGNSLKYRKPDSAPVIHILAAQSGSDWVITVKDNGIGFRPEQAERIFGVFQRLHKTEFAGTGIGLSICKRIVERRGGRIWATAEPDQGAAFSFSIPSSTAAGGDEQVQEYTQRIISAGPSSLETATADQRSSSSHFDELFHTLALAQAIVRDLDGNILIWTQGSEHLFGWSEAEAVGKRLHELIGTESATPLSEIEADLLRKGEWTGELKARKRDGRTVWLASHCALYCDGSGRPQSVIEVHNDITALKEAQAALLRSSEQRDLALHAGQMGTWRWDSQTGVVEWSAALEALLGMEPGSFEGTYDALQERIHPDDRGHLRERISEAFEKGPYYTVENRLLKNDGTYMWVRGQGRVLSDEHNQPAGLVGVVWNIGERKQQEADRQFLLDLGAKLSRCSERHELAATAVRGLGKYLNVSGCGYAEIDLSGKYAEAVADYSQEGQTESSQRNVARTYALDSFGDVMADLAANRLVSVADAETDPRTAENYSTAYLPLNIRAFLTVPLHQHGIWRAFITVADKSHRQWDECEKDLIQAVAERLWPALENARLLLEARIQQEEFQSTFEQAAVGMAHVALDGRWLRVNDRICDITGYSREELLASSFQQITHPDDLATDLAQYESLQRGEIPSYSMEKRYFHKNGSIVWIKLTVSVMRQSSGAPEYAISVIEDISARKKTAQELEATHSLAALRLREIEAIYSQAPVGLVFLDKDLRFVRINHHLAAINGLPAADHIGRKVSEIVPQSGLWREPMLRKVMETRQPVLEVELRGRSIFRPAEDSIWLVSYFPLEGPEGTMLGLNGVVQDITERKKTETAWLETADRLRLATSAARLGVFVWDVQKDRAYWENEQMYQIVGRRHEDGPVNHEEFLANVVLPEDAASHAKAVNDSIETGEPFTSAVRIRRSDGKIRWVEFSGRFEMDAARNPLRLTGVMGDITDRMEAERLLRDQKQHLRRVLDALFTFVGVLNLDGVLLEVNRAPLEAAGITSDEVVGKPFPETYWWSHSAEARKLISDSILKAKNGEPSRFDLLARMKNDELLTLDWMISPLSDETGDIAYLIASAVPIEERKRMEEALRLSEERYLLSEWDTNDGLWDWNPVSDDCYFSPRFKALLGFEPAEMENRGSAVFSRLHPDSSPILFEAVRRHIEEGLPYDVEIRVRLKNGTYRWFRSRGKAVPNDKGQVTRMIGSMTDIHARKEVEMLSQQHDEQLRDMIDSIEQLAWMAHADGYVFWYNRRWYEYTGTTPEQMQGWGWQGVQRPDRLAEVTERWQNSLETGEPFDMEFPMRGADGVYRAFLTRVRPVRDSQGSVVRWFGTNTNVEGLRREQELLKESERKFRELAETLPELLWVADSQGLVTYHNPQWGSYTGISSIDGQGDGWISIIHPEDSEIMFRRWREAVATGKSYACEARVRRYDGAFRWFLNRAEAVRDGQGRIVQWLGTSTDIHEQKLTEQALRRSNEDLEQFAYAASHDLQEPLRTVSIYSQLMARRYGEQRGDAERFASFIVSGTARMESLLKGLLAYSRVGEAADSSARCDSNAVLRTVLSSLEATIADTGAAIKWDHLPVVQSSESHLFQLFQNIIGNALTYHADRPVEINVSSSLIPTPEGGRWCEFSVADNGIGIKPEYFNQVFGMFKRLHRDAYPGVGVGLAICKRIVERYGGRIWLESEPDLGTTFYFTLPAAADYLNSPN